MKHETISLAPALAPASFMAIECISFDDEGRVASRSRTPLMDIVRGMTVSLPPAPQALSRA